MIEITIAIIGVALLFDALNGMHDCANSIATVVSTRVLSPKVAVIWAALFNFLAAFGFGVNVASTIGKGIVVPPISELIVSSALAGAIFWSAVTILIGLPISSSHSLIGGLIGASIVGRGFPSIIFSGVFKVVLFMVIAPLLGLAAGFLMMSAVAGIVVRLSLPPLKLDSLFRRLQLISAAMYSLGHGTNDAQKTMGIISALLFSAGYLGPQFYIPVWVIIISYAAIALGTLAGGWRIVRTMGMRIAKIRPIHGFSAETVGGVTLFGTAMAGIPVSTTHVIAGSIMGVGATRRLSAVRWGVTRNIVWAWILTIPLSATVAAAVYTLITLISRVLI